MLLYCRYICTALRPQDCVAQQSLCSSVEGAVLHIFHKHTVSIPLHNVWREYFCPPCNCRAKPIGCQQHSHWLWSPAVASFAVWCLQRCLSQIVLLFAVCVNIGDVVWGYHSSSSSSSAAGRLRTAMQSLWPGIPEPCWATCFSKVHGSASG